MKRQTLSKFLTLLLLLCVTIAIFTACGGSTEQENGASNGESSDSISKEENNDSNTNITPDDGSDSKNNSDTNDGSDKEDDSKACEHKVIIDAAVEATCETEGKTEGSHCDKCGEIINKQEKVPSKGHSWQDATCETPKTCSVCNKTEGTALPHNWSAATCELPKTCTRCNTTEGEKKGHKWENGFCSVCKSEKYSEGLYYVLNQSKNEYTLKHIGSCTDTQIIIPAVYNGLPVTAIANGAFSKETSIESVIIGKNIKTIGEDAFWDCTKLATVIIPNGVVSIGGDAFYDCIALTSIIIPDSVISIGETAFYNCERLSNISLPDSIQQIGKLAFGYTQYYNTKTNWENNVLYIGNHLIRSLNYKGNYTIKSGTICIANYAFYEEDGLQSITMPDSVKYIGNRAFSDCQYVKTITISNGVQTIGDYAFYRCLDLRNLTIPSSVTTIGEFAFYACRSIDKVHISRYVTSIGTGAFAVCLDLENISVDKENPVYYSETNCIIEKESKMLVAGCYTSTIPNDIRIIGDYVFAELRDLESIVIPQSIERIGNHAFASCNSLKNIILPTNLKTIGHSAFTFCESLKSIAIPNGVTDIGDSAFLSSGITSISIPASVTSIGKFAFRWCDNQLSEVYIFDLAAWCNINFKDGEANPLCYATKLYLNGTLVTDLVIPSGTTNIGNYAFYNYQNLKTVIIPASVICIGNYAFSDCVNLSDIWIEAKSVSQDWSKSWNQDCPAMLHLGNTWKYVNGVPTLKTNSGSQGLEYTFIEEQNAYTVIGIGSCTDTHIVIPDYYDDIPVTSIAKEAFSGCNNIFSVTIGDSVTTIGDLAFDNCQNLESIFISETVTNLGNNILCGCNSLTDIEVSKANPVYYSDGNCVIEKSDMSLIIGCKASVIPNNVKRLGEYAFSYCSGLVSITLPDSIIAIGGYALRGCPDLATIVVSKNNPVYYSQDNCIIEKDTGVLILGCKTSIVPSNITQISDYAFYNCESLKHVDISDSVTHIGDFAFFGCSSLESIHIPGSVTHIGESAFLYCSALTSITVDKANPIYCSDGNCLIEKKTHTLILGCNNSEIPNNISKIDDYAFYMCSSFTNIVIPQSVTSIGDYAFFYCANLKTVIIPDSVEHMGELSFGYCMNIQNIWCESKSQPSNWNADWNYLIFGTTHWGDTWEYVNGIPTLK